jgi:DNA repair and recombination protein RAD54B
MRKSQLPSSRPALLPLLKPTRFVSSFPSDAPQPKKTKRNNENTPTNVSIKPETTEKPEHSELVFHCTFRKPQAKKHKTWDGDGFVIAMGKSFTLKDEEGKQLAQINANYGTLESGQTISIGGKEIEIGEPAKYAEYASGRLFLSNSLVSAPLPVTVAAKGFKNPMTDPSRIQSANSITTPAPKPRHDPNSPGICLWRD